MSAVGSSRSESLSASRLSRRYGRFCQADRLCIFISFSFPVVAGIEKMRKERILKVSPSTRHAVSQMPPRLRGVLHQVAAIVALPTAMVWTLSVQAGPPRVAVAGFESAKAPISKPRGVETIGLRAVPIKILIQRDLQPLCRVRQREGDDVRRL